MESDPAHVQVVVDLTFLEVINLFNIGLACYNIRQQAQSNISANNQFIPANHLKSEKYLGLINSWSVNQKMINRSALQKCLRNEKMKKLSP